MRRVRLEDIWMAALAAVIGLAACASVQGLCFAIPTEESGRPWPRTPRAGYCGPIDHWYRWLAFPALAVLVTVVARLVLSRVPHRRAISVGLLSVLAFANFVVVNSLDYYVPI